MPNWPNYEDAVAFSPEGPGVQLLHIDDKMKVLLVGLEPGQSLPPHEGPGASFSFLSGSGTMVIGDEEIEVSAGSLAVVPRGANRSIRTDDDRLVFMGTLSDPNATHHK